MAEYTLGTVVRVTGTFKTNNVVADPSAVTVTIKTPLGVETTLTYGVDNAVVRSSTGIYYYNYTPALEGRYAFRWAGTGTNAGAEEGTFDVKESLFNG